MKINKSLSFGKFKTPLLVSLKFIISITTLFFVFSFLETKDLLSKLLGINFYFVISALLTFWIAQFISSLRFVYVAKELGIKLPFFVSLQIHFVGLWFNQFLPGGVGGDILKVSLITKNIGLSKSIFITFLDRFSGLLIMIFAILITFPLYKMIIPVTNMIAIYAIMAIFLLAIGIIFFILGILKSPLMTVEEQSKWYVVVQFFNYLLLFKRPQPLWKQFWTSSIVHLGGILTYWLLSKALGISIGVIECALIVPLVFLFALLPISFAGWGVRELGAVWLFGLIGVSESYSTMLSMTYGLMLIVAGLPGLLIFLFYKTDPITA